MLCYIYTYTPYIVLCYSCSIIQYKLRFCFELCYIVVLYCFMLLYVILSYVMLCHIMSHYFCDVVCHSYGQLCCIMLKCLSILLAEENTRIGREEGKTRLRASLSRASLLQSSVFETHHASTVCKWGGCAPSDPPRL